MNLDIDNHNLIEECRAGNRDALGILYNKFAPKMLGVISRYIPSQADAQDILHDGFIVAFTRLNSLKDPDKLEFWLATIMKNLALQFLQSQDIVEVLENLPDDGDTPKSKNSSTSKCLNRSSKSSLQAIRQCSGSLCLKTNPIRKSPKSSA